MLFKAKLRYQSPFSRVRCVKRQGNNSRDRVGYLIPCTPVNCHIGIMRNRGTIRKDNHPGMGDHHHLMIRWLGSRDVAGG